MMTKQTKKQRSRINEEIGHREHGVHFSQVRGSVDVSKTHLNNSIIINQHVCMQKFACENVVENVHRGDDDDLSGWRRSRKAVFGQGGGEGERKNRLGKANRKTNLYISTKHHEEEHHIRECHMEFLKVKSALTLPSNLQASAKTQQQRVRVDWMVCVGGRKRDDSCSMNERQEGGVDGKGKRGKHKQRREGGRGKRLLLAVLTDL